MGSTTQAILAVFRLFQLAFATVIAGVIGHYLTFRGSDASSRIVYSVTLAGISMFFALLFLILFRHSFYAFAIDFILFICWIVDFGLMASLSGGCNSAWYVTRWGGFWGRRVIVGQPGTYIGNGGCGPWRATLAFSFLGAIVWFISGCLGAGASWRQRKNQRLNIREGHNEKRSGDPETAPATSEYGPAPATVPAQNGVNTA